METFALKKCPCNNVDCKRVVKETYEGKTYQKNTFTCGYYKNLKEILLNIKNNE